PPRLAPWPAPGHSGATRGLLPARRRRRGRRFFGPPYLGPPLLGRPFLGRRFISLRPHDRWARGRHIGRHRRRPVVVLRSMALAAVVFVVAAVTGAQIAGAEPANSPPTPSCAAGDGWHAASSVPDGDDAVGSP